MQNKIIFLFLLLLCFSLPVQAVDTGKLLTNQCRANLKMLNDAVAKFLSENDSALPAWSPYENVKTMLLEIKYLPKDPELPTKDCKYHFVSLSTHDYQWYCDLHGMLEGDKSVTFNYHEHKFTAKTNSRYQNIKKYKDHMQNLLRWTEYNPTPVEKLKYHYNKNPATTIALFVIAAIALLFVYKNVFH